MSKKALAVEQENAVWIVDDDVLIARVLSHWLMQRGFEVEIIKNGRDAIETMARQDRGKKCPLSCSRPNPAKQASSRHLKAVPTIT